jgi:glycosyltransferase involved in cell wall biosynthesis
MRGGINWSSVSLIKHGPFAYSREAKRIIQNGKPDWIVGFSDTYYGILAQRLGVKYQIKSIIDAYDNYESYIPWAKPLHAMWRESLSQADLVTAAGPSLADLLKQHRPSKQTVIAPMAADPQFQPMDKIKCRQKLGLHVDKKIIGYSGSTVVSGRGVETLFNAFDRLKQESENMELVITGRKGRGVNIPRDAKWLGYLPDEKMPLLMNSLDVLVVMNKDSIFGNYSYPVKLYEAMKCRIPVVVSRTLSTEWIMQSYKDLLVDPENPTELADKIIFAQALEETKYENPKNWDEIATNLLAVIEKN